jgi:HSP20 family molecular chaperone IbpA
MDQWQEPANASTVMAFELPGVQASDLQLTIREGHLVVSGERKCPGNRQGKDAPPALGHELRYGKFKRAVFIRPDLQVCNTSG